MYDYWNNSPSILNKIIFSLFVTYLSSVFIFNSMVNLNNGQELGNTIITEFKHIGMPPNFEVNNFNLIRKIGGGRSLVTRFYTTGNIEDVKKYYADHLASSGWISTSNSEIYYKDNLKLRLHFFNNYWTIDIYTK